MVYLGSWVQSVVRWLFNSVARRNHCGGEHGGKAAGPEVEQQEGISTETRPQLATSFISALPRFHHLPISYLKFESVSGSA